VQTNLCSKILILFKKEAGSVDNLTLNFIVGQLLKMCDDVSISISISFLQKNAKKKFAGPKHCYVER
jgi:hypothetical protein